MKMMIETESHNGLPILPTLALLLGMKVLYNWIEKLNGIEQFVDK